MLTIADLIRTGELDGYAPQRPPRGGLIDGTAIDERVCAESCCVQCGHQGLDYHPYYDGHHRRYRAFAVCPVCKHADEF